MAPRDQIYEPHYRKTAFQYLYDGVYVYLFLLFIVTDATDKIKVRNVYIHMYDLTAFSCSMRCRI